MRAFHSFLLLGVAFLSLLGGCKRTQQIPFKDGKAMSDVRQIGVGLWSYMVDYKDMTPLVGNATAGIIKADEVLTILTLTAPETVLAAKNKEKTQYVDWSKGKGFSDPWGNPYMIAWQKNTTPLTDSHGSKLTYSFFVWSYGTNGINEFGQGDDLFSLNSEQMPLSRYPNASLTSTFDGK
ncbi:MAG: hypothetical protein ABI615_07115 [Chthoniobacterales bacterium]